jgi:hypothetical protein
VQTAVAMICLSLGIISLVVTTFFFKSDEPGIFKIGVVMWAKKAYHDFFHDLENEFALWNGCCTAALSQHGACKVCFTKAYTFIDPDALVMLMHKVGPWVHPDRAVGGVWTP